MTDSMLASISLDGHEGIVALFNMNLEQVSRWEVLATLMTAVHVRLVVVGFPLLIGLK